MLLTNQEITMILVALRILQKEYPKTKELEEEYYLYFEDGTALNNSEIALASNSGGDLQNAKLQAELCEKLNS